MSGNSLGLLLEQLRQQHGMTKKDLAEAADLSAGYISHIIKGSKKPSPKAIIAVAQALNLDQNQQQVLWQAADYSSPENIMIARSQRSLQNLVDPSVGSGTKQESELTSIHADLPRNIAEQWISKETKLIRIQDTWVIESLLLDIGRVLRKISHKAVSIEVLLLEEDTPAAIQRARELSDPKALLTDTELAEYAKLKIAGNIADLEQIARYGVESIVVKKHGEMPHFELFSCDDRTLVGLFALGERASRNPQIETKGSDTFLGRFVRGEFKKRWDESNKTAIATKEGKSFLNVLTHLESDFHNNAKQ